MSFPALDDEVGPAATKHMLGEYSVNVAAIVTVSYVVPGRILPRLFLAWCCDDFFDPGFSTIGTFWICHETLTWVD